MTMYAWSVISAAIMCSIVMISGTSLAAPPVITDLVVSRLTLDVGTGQQDVTVSVHVFDPDDDLKAQGVKVIVRPTEGTKTKIVLVDDGTGSDQVPGDERFSGTLTIDTNMPQHIGLAVKAKDREKNKSTLGAIITIGDPATSPTLSSITVDPPALEAGTGVHIVVVSAQVDDPNDDISSVTLNQLHASGKLRVLRTLRSLADNGSGVDPIAGDGIYTAQATFDTTTAQTVPLQILATDTAGHRVVHELDLFVRVDTVPPELSITSPIPGTAVLAARQVITGTASDVTLARITCNTMPATLEDETFACPELTLAPGANDIAVVAIDTLGNRTVVTPTFVLEGRKGFRDLNAFIYTQVSYSDEDGRLALQHVFNPESFFTSDQTGVVYRFKNSSGQGCRRFKPVFADGTVLFDDTPSFAHAQTGLSVVDHARRTITDVFYLDGCPSENDAPRFEQDVFDLEQAGKVELVPNVDIVNAPSVPSPSLRPNAQLWEAPPDGINIYNGRQAKQKVSDNLDLNDIVTDVENVLGLPGIVRPRLQGWSEGRKMHYVTYEICSDEQWGTGRGSAQWQGTGFCVEDGVRDVLFTRSGPTISLTGMANVRPGISFPKAEIASGNIPATGAHYSPILAGMCIGGVWTGSRGFAGADVASGPPGANCFGPTPAEVNAFTTANSIALPGEVFPPDDLRHGVQIRTSDDIAALEGMNGFSTIRIPWEGTIKITNSPVIAVDLNQDRKFSRHEFISFPNHVLKSSTGGNFNVFNPGSPFLAE